MKKNNKKGFTLAELLIVVAIIAVLTAIAIPVFTSQLEKSREATDISNIRAYYAEIVPAILTGDLTGETGATTTNVSGKTATISKSIKGISANDTFDVTVAAVTFQQQQAGWQTASFEIAGVKGSPTSTATDGVAQWASTSASVKYTFTVQTDGDYLLTSIDLPAAST